MVLVFLTANTELDPITWTSLLEKFQKLIPLPWLWIIFPLVGVAVLFLLDIGDKYSGIFGSPFQKSQLSADQLEKTRRKLLKIIQKDVERRLATSLHELVKLDLYMKDQHQRVGKSKLELVSEDTPKKNDTGFPSVNRVLIQTCTSKPRLNLKLTQKIIEVFERPDIQGKLLILGEPGAGKTTELLYLAKSLAIRANEDEQYSVPVILELSNWNGESISNWVAEQLNKFYNISKTTTEQWLIDHQILLLLDGLDELALAKQKQCIETINQFLETTHTPELVVCCRREEYEVGQSELNELNGAIYLEALETAQIHKYFEKLDRLSIWESISSNPVLLKLAKKPLFLFMLVVAYQGKPIQNEQDLFDAYISKQLHEPRNQVVYKLNKAPSSKQTSLYLVWLARQLEIFHETEFLIEDLQPTWLSSTRQKRLYRLFVGLLLGLLGGLLVGLIYGPFIGLLVGLMYSPLVGLSVGLTFGPISGLLVGLIFVLSADIEHDIVSSKDTLNLSFLRKAIRGYCIALIDGLGSGLTFGLVSNTSKATVIQPKEKLQWSFSQMINGLRFGPLKLRYIVIVYIFSIFLVGVINALVFQVDFIKLPIMLSGLLLSLFMIGLILGLTSVSIREKDFPNQGIKKGFQNALILGLTIGILFGVFALVANGAIEELAARAIIGVMTGLAIGLMVGLAAGLGTAIQHLILRVFLTKNGYAPWNYARFLEHAVKHRFIQRTGGRYRFIHDLLRKHFAQMSLD